MPPGAFPSNPKRLLSKCLAHSSSTVHPGLRFFVRIRILSWSAEFFRRHSERTMAALFERTGSPPVHRDNHFRPCLSQACCPLYPHSPSSVTSHPRTYFSCRIPAATADEGGVSDLQCLFQVEFWLLVGICVRCQCVKFHPERPEPKYNRNAFVMEKLTVLCVRIFSRIFRKLIESRLSRHSWKRV